jgi:hypothetical protein
MTSDSSKNDFPKFFADAESAERVRRQFIDAPMEGARQSALSSALELAKVLSALPEAFAASQRRELERLKSSGQKDDPRIAFLEASIEEANALHTMARRGAARAQRTTVALASGKEVFHGFVSDGELNPLPGLTVRLTGDKEKAKELSATTEADGYFNISLGGKRKSSRGSAEDAANIALERIAELFSHQEREKDARNQPASAFKSVGRVEILRKTKVIHEDPVRIPLNEGSVYREYVISKE